MLKYFAASIAIAALWSPIQVSSPITPSQHYSTCPDFEHAVIRNVGYVEVSESKLLKWADVKVYPKQTSTPEIVRVNVQVEGETVFCASALSGPADKQKLAVDSVMRWHFKPNRGDFKYYLMGTLSFRI